MNDFDFYNVIKKPNYAPKRELFGRVWSFLYFLMLISLLIFYFQPLSFSKIFATPLFCLQFILNILWTAVFFKLKKIKTALLMSIVLFMCVFLMTSLFFRMSFLLGILQIPYLVWLACAIKLNYDILSLNEDSP